MQSDYIIRKTDPNNGHFVIRAYTTDGPESPLTTTPLYSNAVSANTSLVLLGKGMFDYGEPIQTNLVHLLENFASPITPVYPVQGQLWYNNAANVLSVYSGSSSPGWIGLACNLQLYSNTIYMSTDNPTQDSWLSKQLHDDSFYPISSLQQTVNAIDKGLTEHLTPRPRYIESAQTHTIIGVGISTSSHAIIGVVNGFEGSWIVAGDVTLSYIIGSKINVSSNGFGDGTYTVINTTYTGGNTIITIAELISPLATAIGQIDASYGVWKINGIDAATDFTVGTNIAIFNNTAGGDGVYSTTSISTYGGNTFISVGPLKLVQASYAGDGAVILETLTLPFTYRVEHNQLTVYEDGLKKYNGIRGKAILPLFDNTLGGNDDTTLLEGSTYSFDIEVDGGTAETISISPVTTKQFTVNQVLLPNYITVNENITNVVFVGQQIQLIGTGTYSSITGTYTIAAIRYMNGITTLNVSESLPLTTIPGGAVTVTLTFQETYTFLDLLQDINDELTTCTCMFQNATFTFYSNTSGMDSSVVVTNIDLFTNVYSGASDYISVPGKNYSYIEVGSATDISNQIKFTVPPAIGSVIEIINMG